MENKKNTKALVESALITSIACIVAIVGIYVPLLGYLLILISVPFIILMIRNGWKYVVLSSLVSSILVGAISFPTYGIYVAVLGGGVGIVIGYFINKGDESSKVIFYGTVATSISFFVIFMIIVFLSGISAIEMIDYMTDEITVILKDAGIESVLTERGVELAKIAVIFKMLIPSSIIIFATIFSIINYFISSVIMQRIGMDISKIKRFSHFSLPNNIMIGTTVILILSYIVGKLNIVNSQVLFINIFYIFVYVFMVQGLAVLVFYMESVKMNIYLKIITIILVFVFQLIIVIAILGWFDSIFDFRKLRREK